MSAKVIQGSFAGRPTGGGPPRNAGPGSPAPRPPHGPPPAARGAGSVQCRSSGGVIPVDPAQIGLASGRGSPLPDRLRSGMEAAFRADFSAVRVHVGLQAARIGAAAFTVGSDIYFAPGRFQPDTVPGRQLLGHELAHVLQQRQGRVRNPLGAGLAIVQDRALEDEADRMAHRVIASAGAGPGALQPLKPVSARPHTGPHARPDTGPGRAMPRNGGAQPKALTPTAVTGARRPGPPVTVHPAPHPPFARAGRQASGAALQARLTIDSSWLYPYFRQRVRTALTQLAGQAATLTFNGGDVGMAPGVPIAPSPSRDLLARIINSPRHIRIRRTDGNNRAEPLGATPALAMQNASNGTGTDVDVFIDNATLLPGAAGTNATVMTPTGAALAPTPASIILGHELAHADRFSRGVGAFGLVAGMGGVANWNLLLGSFTRHTGMAGALATEEVYTVGLPVAGTTPINPDALAVSENDLRAEHGLNIRVGYP